MQRPLIWFSVAFAVGCGIALFGVSIPLAAAVLMLAASIIIGRLVSPTIPVCVLLAGLTCGLAYTDAYHRYITDPVSGLEGLSQHMTVTAADYAVQYEDSQRLEVRVDGSDVGLKTGFRTLAYLPLTEEEIKPGDTITGKFEFYISGLREGFDRESYYRSQGYFVLASVNKNAEITVTQPEYRPLSYYPKLFAQKLRDVFAQYGTERQISFWNALATGDRSDLTTADRDHLRKAGLSHVIALSGMHVGFLISLLLLVFGRKLGTALGIPALLAFYLMVGWSPSVVRACVMYGILLLSFWVRRQSDSMNSLFAALLLILVILPDSLTSVSLQLSFAATFDILCFASRIQYLLALPKRVRNPVKRLYRVLSGTVACTVSSTAITAPILLYHFGYLSVFSVLSNLLALWAVSLVFPLLFIGGVSGLFVPTAAAVLLTPAGWLTDYILWVSDWIAGLPYGLLYCENHVDFAFAIVLSALAALLLWKGSRRVLAAGIPLLVLLVVGISVWRGTAVQNDLHISVLPEGSGQAIVISCGEQAALIDCSGSGYHNAAEDVAAYLDWYGIDSLDLVILTSVDLGHARNVCELFREIPVERVLLPQKNRENKTPYPEVIQTMETLGISYEMLAPETETAVGNDSLGLSVLGTVERKLVVRIQSEDQDIVTVHALTQNMLLELTDQTPLPCDTLLVSGGFSENTEKMQELLRRIAPSQIVLESGWESGTDYGGIPIVNPYYTGQIDWKTERD